VATAREREATLLADVASAILAGHDMRSQLKSISNGIAAAVGASRARVVLEAVPSPQDDELSFTLGARSTKAWLYVSRDLAWEPEEVERICQPVGQLVDVAVEREQVADRAAETEAARRADVARTAILHAISHDLRSPLTAITTAGSALRSHPISERERDELLEVIDVEGARLARLVSDLLDMSRIQAGAAAPQADWCDLHDVVVSAAGHLQTEHPLEFALPPELPLIRADAAQLERVFSNLIENAVKYSPADAPVRVSAGVGGGRVTVRVSDRGRGIPPALRSRVFEPFVRARGEAGTGSGLGLAICRGFVEANGGQIVLQSHRERGTSFAVSFPLVDQPQPVA
jgi:two-component system sensor histidine kinase KdpD